jgi:REP element-mobilizing transposase RayT
MHVITNHTYIHAMFCTKNCRRLILPEYEKKLWKSITEFGSRNASPVSSVGGTNDHVHIVITPLPSKTIDSLIKEIKEYTKRFMNNAFYSDNRAFDWQVGYGAFSTSRSNLTKLANYIDNQKILHESMTYEEEFIRILERNGVEYDKNGLLD